MHKVYERPHGMQELLYYTAEQFRQGQRDAVAAHVKREEFCERHCCWSGHRADCFGSKDGAAPLRTTGKDAG